MERLKKMSKEILLELVHGRLSYNFLFTGYASLLLPRQLTASFMFQAVGRQPKSMEETTVLTVESHHSSRHRLRHKLRHGKPKKQLVTH
ncbi:DNA mismatch repair protein MSH3 [Fusarium oxysporum f. sp. albedinis]|nr:DNA mismatch repair protein MSH3 [Fusarium oxysporum f. sp. albedinis]